MSRTARVLERVAIVLASLALSFGLIALLSGFFAGRDQAGITGLGTIPGQRLPSQGDAHLQPGQLHPPYASAPPASGPHVVVPVTRQDQQLSDDQLLTALERGNVVVLYGTLRPPAGLTQLAMRVAGGFSAALAAAGQAVIVGHRPGTRGLIALAWARRLQVASAADPELAQFAQQALGHGAGRA